MHLQKIWGLRCFFLRLQLTDDPIAVIEILQMMRIETIAHIGHPPDRGLNTRFKITPGHGSIGVGMLPCLFVTRVEFLWSHQAGLEHNMLGVIQLPILGKDATLSFKSFRSEE